MKMDMRYISTRGDKKSVSAGEAIVKGIAPDGGLYVPVEIPKINISMEMLAKLSYSELAYEVLKLYLTDFTEAELRVCVQNAYGQGFDDPAVAPVVEANGAYFLELFHGRTLAFKDMALSILPHFMMTAAKKMGLEKEICILTATSGDTGKAALAGFADVPGTRIVVFYPDGGVSEVQKLQMVTQEGDNTCVVGVRGNFDDAQTGVKCIFADKAFEAALDAKGIVLSSANSINIGRLVPQIVYYFYAYGRMLASGAIQPKEEINFVVPTGNFGNILAGYYAKKMGLPVKSLLCASNSNRVLHDFFSTSVYDKNREFILTASPSMDILVSSNLERLLFDLSGNGDEVASLMSAFNTGGKYTFDASDSGITSAFASEQETADAIAEMHAAGYVMDTHTAVAYKAWRKTVAETGGGTKTVVVSTASPYKFGASVCSAITGKNYENTSPDELFAEVERLSGVSIPTAIAGIAQKPIRHTTICDTNEMQAVVQNVLAI